MTLLQFDDDPWDEFERLRTDDIALARAADRVFDDLEADPRKPYLTRTYLRPRGIYKVVVPTAAGYSDHMILWDLDDDVVVIRYLGPDFVNA